jgi:hypothetical protein
MNSRPGVVALLMATGSLTFTLQVTPAQTRADDKTQTCQIVYEQMRQYEQSRPGTAAAFGRAFLNEDCGQVFPTVVAQVRNYLAAVQQQQRTPAASPQPVPPAVPAQATNLDRLPPNGLTETFVKQYIQRDEERFVASDRPPVTVTLSFRAVEIGRPRPYPGGFILGLAEGQTVHPVRIEYTRVRSSAIRTESVTQKWDYLFYMDVDGRLKHSATLVETIR